MTLKRRTILTTGLTLAGLVAAVFSVASWVLMSGFLRVERTLTERNIRRALDGIAAEVSHLSMKLSDWAAWDDTYRFIEDRNDEYVTSNLGEPSVRNLGLAMMLFLDAEGGVAREVAVGEGEADGSAIAGALLSRVESRETFFAHERPESAKGGLLVVGGRCALVASRPIITSELQGPPRGTLVWGAWLDGEAQRRLARRLHMSLEVWPLERAGEFVDGSILARLRAGTAGEVRADGDKTVYGYAVVHDAHGQPAAVVRTGTPRFVYAQARLSLLYLLGSLLATGAAGTGVLMLVLSRLVLGRLARLSEAVNGIGSSMDLARRVPERGNDEVTVLQREINRLLARVERAQEALSESETRFRTMADGAPVLIWLTDSAGRCTYLNRAWCEFTGRPAEEQVGGGWAESIHPDDLPSVRRDWEAHLLQRRAFRFEYRLRRHDGAYRWILVQGSPRFGGDGAFEGFIGACSDVTESREAADRLRRQAADLTRAKTQLESQAAELESARLAAEAANRAKDHFLANVSHEIRTPMTAILGYADLLADPALEPEDRLSCVETVRRNGQHLLTLINDILDLSKIEAGRMELEVGDCAAHEIAAEAAALMRLRAEAKGITLVVEQVPPLPASVRTDPVRFRQIVVNLVSNAVKFTEAGEVRVVTRVARAPGGAGGPGGPEGPPRDTLRVEVTDTGIGMSPEQVARLFRPFTQGDASTSRRFGGSGLGLSISKSLAELMGATIEVRSRAGEGSCFAIVFPLPEGWERHAAPEGAPAPAESGDATGSALLAGADILLIEDGADNRRLLEHYLSRAGARVRTAENGRIGVRAATERGIHRPFDVVLMDMQMPEVDGYEATRALRRAGYAGAIIAVTAHSRDGDRERCVEAGCNDYLPKPVDRSALVRACARWRGRRHEPAAN